MLSCGRLRNTVNCATSSCLTSLRVLRTAQLTVLCDYVSKACKLTCYTGRNCCFCVLIRPSLTADRSIWLLLLQLQASAARSTVNAVVSTCLARKVFVCRALGKADVLTWFFSSLARDKLVWDSSGPRPKKVCRPLAYTVQFRGYTWSTQSGRN